MVQLAVGLAWGILYAQGRTRRTEPLRQRYWGGGGQGPTEERPQAHPSDRDGARETAVPSAGHKHRAALREGTGAELRRNRHGFWKEGGGRQ